MSSGPILSLTRLTSRLRRAREGVAAIEFLLLAPIMVVIIFGVVDLGNVLYTKFRLTDGVAAASTYALAKADDVSTDKATDLAKSMAQLVGNNNGTNWANVTIVVNNGPVGTISGGIASATTTTTNSTNGLCYCPNSNTDFGGGKICGITCGGGGTAGRYVRITARRNFTPIFSSYGVVSADGFITVSQMVQTE
jgi:Flp pilus assembly protein TadG